MITMTSFGSNGRLGNQLFQYAAALGFSKKYNLDIVMPEWKTAGYFEGKYPEGPQPEILMPVKEEAFSYNGDITQAINHAKKHNLAVSLKGYYQTEKYFDHCADDIRAAFKFKKAFVIDCLEQYVKVFQKEVIAIHIRRGDYVDNSNYHNLQIHYYISALEKHFPGWRDKNLLIFSDDTEYAKVHFQCLRNAFFAERNPPIVDLCLMSQCNHFIIANSSFSWWGAWLGEKEGTKVVRPTEHFEGRLKQTCDIKDLYPERWIAHAAEKIDLRDTVFTIPVFFDHQDRKQNLDLCVCMLQSYFETHIIVCEQGGKKMEYMSKWCHYMEAAYEFFHRTRMLNEMAKHSQHIGENPPKIVANWDADVVIAPMQILETVHRIREGADMAYPYEWMFARIPRQEWFSKLEKYMDIGIVRNTKFMGMRDGDAVSYGGAVMFNIESFFRGGMENERFISFGPEDSERRDRFTALDYRMERVGGPLYHINHWVGPNSNKTHQHFQSNREEYKKVAHMKKNQIEDYKESWTWIPEKYRNHRVGSTTSKETVSG